MNSLAQTHCGRGLAPDSYLTANDSVDWYTAIGGKPPPTLVCGHHG
ncbi:MAG: hypothetical protein K0S85_2766 [Pseudomonas orientalis]|nr:hypothetical protein [Pseudomonas orientalis]